MKTKPVLFPILLFFPIPLLSAAETAGEIMQKVTDNQNPSSRAMDMEMEILDARGNSSYRRLQTLTLNREGLTSSITIFLEPAPVRNTRFLTIQNSGRPDDQWIFLPALGRTRRIASGERNGSFMGSDFSYSDMEGQQADESDHSLLREESLEARDCWVVESVPRSGSGSPYGRMISWVDKATYLTLRVDLYLPGKSEPEKRIRMEGFRQVQNRWTADTTEMETLATGHRTRISVRQVKFDIPLSPDYFSTAFLQTGRLP